MSGKAILFFIHTAKLKLDSMHGAAFTDKLKMPRAKLHL